MATIAGMAFIKVNGRSYESQGEFTVKLGGSKLDPMVMASGAIHRSETLIPGMITGTIATINGLSINALKDMKNAVVQIQSKSGHVYIMKNAFFSGEGEANPKEGTFAVEFTGSPIKVIS